MDKIEISQQRELVLTTTVKIKSETSQLLPVRTDKPISRDKLKKAMKKISKLQAKAPIYVGDIVKKNFLEKGTNLISTKTVEK
ncbi:MAG: DUF1667 domain-containing protein [Clostridia bacterium]|nr:DUF1667 domain-containing protein [Clostridia bacterium]